MTSTIFGILGFVVGCIIAGILLVVFNKDKKIRTEYDERQRKIKNEGYRLGFIVLVVWEFLASMFDTSENVLLVSTGVLTSSGIMVAIFVACGYAIWNEGYWGQNNNKRAYITLFVVLTILMVGMGSLLAAKGAMVENGIIQYPAMIFSCAAMMIGCLIVIGLKERKDRLEQEDE